MSTSRALRSETLAAYRRLFRASHRVTRDCPLHRTDGLPRYVSARFRAAAEHNRRRFLELRPPTPSGERSMKRQYERFLAAALRRVGVWTESLLSAPGSGPRTSMLQVLAAGVGNAAYQRAVERDFVRYADFEARRAARREGDAAATSERQNRVMQHALMGYGERLRALHRLRTASGAGSGGPSAAFTPAQLTAAIAGGRGGVSAHLLSHGREHVVLEVDEAFGRQVVYVRGAAPDWGAEVERVEVAEPEELRGTVLHADCLAVASRLCEALLAESPIHAQRGTVVVGHGVGGAVGLCLALLLHARGFEVTNCITFGAPKAVQSTLQRYMQAVTPIRVVLEGDPLVELPVSGAEGDPFVHYGEILLMGNASRDATAAEREKRVEEDDTETSISADVLADLLEGGHDTNDNSIDSHARHTHEGDEHIIGMERRSAMDDSVYENEDDSNNESEEDDVGEMRRLAARRYEAAYTPEHYIERLLDTSTPLTYAEGDEVWDEGDYAQMRREFN